VYVAGSWYGYWWRMSLRWILAQREDKFDLLHN
jgi:hypothetical protein